MIKNCIFSFDISGTHLGQSLETYLVLDTILDHGRCCSAKLVIKILIFNGFFKKMFIRVFNDECTYIAWCALYSAR